MNKQEEKNVEIKDKIKNDNKTKVKKLETHIKYYIFRWIKEVTYEKFKHKEDKQTSIDYR